MSAASSSGRGGGSDLVTNYVPTEQPGDIRDDDVFVCPASLTQEGLWFIDQLDPGRPTYNIPTAFELRGTVDWAVFQACIDELVARHESLRTGFASSDGTSLQVISLNARVEVQHIGLVCNDGRDAELRRLLQTEASTPFNLSTPPLLRVRTFGLDPARHVVSFVFHHIIADGWSLAVFFQELGQLYSALLAGRPSPLTPITLQYADYAIWQRERLTPEFTEAQLSHWREVLRDAPDAVELPTDRPRPVRPSGRGDTEWFAIDAETTRRLREVSRSEHVTMFMAIVTLIDILVARHTGEYDVVIGTPMASRTRQELEGTVGFFANTLVVRSTLSADLSFRDALRRVRAATLDAYEHADVPFHQVVGTVRPDRASAGNPLFQVMCAFQNVPNALFTLPDIDVEPLEISSATAKFDLLFEFQERATAIEGSLEYSTDLFDRATIDRWLQRLATLAESAVRLPDAPVFQLPLLPPDEQRQIAAWSATSVEPTGHTVVDVFEQQALVSPMAPAVQFGDTTLSYRELNNRANRLARLLQARGIAPGERVGICLERSTDMAIAVLAALKAGAAYVPMDPAYPSDRLAFMADDADLKALLSDGGDAARALPDQSRILALDDCWAASASLSCDNLPVALSAADACFVMYTSGSTGRPKGVVMPHGPLANLIAWQLARGDRGLRTLQYGSLSFDVSFQELFSTWASGGQLVIIPESARRNADELLTIIRHERIERLFVPFIALQLLAETAVAKAAVPTTLKEVITAGEQLRVTPAIRALFAANPGCTLDNQYGPTETHVVTAHRLSGAPATWPELPPIGRPIANTQIELLDAKLQAVPIGVAGDLWIGGACLADGYWRRPDLTAERFVRRDVTGGSDRLYRSGDRARYTKDGAIEFLGRGDDQVKIRGFRVEPAEVEVILEKHPGVKQAAVVPRGRAAALTLAAYYVAAEGANPTPAELREFLRAVLPDYMVPAAFVPLAVFPVTPSGKINRRGLPALDEVQDRHGETLSPPKNAIEEQLLAIWKDVLDLTSIGTHDSFFDIGGHSLAGVRVVARIAKNLGVALPMSTLFTTPTIAALAEVVGAEITGGQHAAPIVMTTVTGPHPLSFAQERMWFIDQLSPDSPVYNIIDALPLNGAADAVALRSTLATLVERHASLRTAIVVRDGVPTQDVAPHVEPPLEELDLMALAPDGRAAAWIAAAREQGRLVFDLARAPLFRALYVHLSDAEHVLILTIHHIVTDEWSMQLIRRELIALFEARRAGTTLALPPPVVQYTDYARWQREWFTDEVRDRQLTHWRQHLSGAPALLELPTDRPRPPMQSYRGATERIDVPRDLFGALQILGRDEQATTFISVLAVFAALLHRYSAQDEVLIGSPISGRTRSETEHLVGLFLNTVVVRSSFEPGMTFRTLLRQVRRHALGAYANQDIPFEQVVADIRPTRTLSHSPLFQVMFILHGAEAPAAGAATQHFRDLDTASAKFDLTLLVSEAGGGLECLFEYNTDLFNGATIRRMAEQFKALLHALALQPDADLSAVVMLPEHERRRILVDWNDTAVAFADGHRSVAELVARQAAAAPDVVALECGPHRLTYREMNLGANQIAAHLAALGVRPGDVVGVLLERSIELIPSVLAILKLGASYLPLDPSFPPSRLRAMVGSSGASALVTHRELERLVPERPPILLRLDSDEAAIAARPATEVLATIAPDDLAYVLYTSGSTGAPKGVEVPHRALVNFLLAMAREPGFTAADTLLAVTTLSFDISALEIFLPLFIGGRVVIAERDDVRNPDRLIALLDQHRVTVMQATPATWRAMIDAGWQGSPALKALCGGERLTVELATLLMPRVCELWNLYGPTETTVWSTCRRIVDADRIDIGRPIANTDVFVLDAHAHPVPVGVTGELYIGGDGLARGYRGRPDLTAERFVEHPLDVSRRAYRTGDRVRWRDDGTVEFLGRNDGQIKLRGFRIELGDIEAALRTAPEVQEAVVVLRDDESPAGPRLVAYVQATATDTAALRAHLKTLIPDYMIPAAFVVLPVLPRTPNGKIDRKNLPAPVIESVMTAAAPLTAAESKVAAIWRDLLEVPSIAAEDDFFALGGHSLLAVKLVHEVERRLSVRLTPAALFEHPTLGALAQRIERSRDGANGPADPQGVMVQLEAGGSGRPFFWVHGIGGEVFSYMQMSRHLGIARPVYGFAADWTEITGSTDITLTQMATRYVREMRAIQPKGPYHLGGFCSAVMLAFEMAKQVEAAGERVGVFAALDYNLAYLDSDPSRSRLQSALSFVSNVPRWIREDALPSGGKDLLGRVRSALRRVGHRLWTSARGDAAPATDLRDRLGMWRFPDFQLPMIKAYFEALGRYRATPIHSHVTLFLPRSAPLRGPWPTTKQEMWRRLAEGGLEVHVVPGSHATMMTEPFLEEMVALLNRRLGEADSASDLPDR